MPDLEYTNIPARGERVPSGEYQGLPEPPGSEDSSQDLPLGGVDEAQALRWAFQYLMPHMFSQHNPADQGELAGDTMPFPEVK